MLDIFVAAHENTSLPLPVDIAYLLDFGKVATRYRLDIFEDDSCAFGFNCFLTFVDTFTLPNQGNRCNPASELDIYPGNVDPLLPRAYLKETEVITLMVKHTKEGWQNTLSFGGRTRKVFSGDSWRPSRRIWEGKQQRGFTSGDSFISTTTGTSGRCVERRVERQRRGLLLWS